MRHIARSGHGRYDLVAMAEATETRSERARQAVLDATADLVAEVGVERTTIDEIANRSGVAKTTIYRHFASKEVLVVEAVHACTSAFPSSPTPDRSATT